MGLSVGLLVIMTPVVNRNILWGRKQQDRTLSDVASLAAIDMAGFIRSMQWSWVCHVHSLPAPSVCGGRDGGREGGGMRILLI